MFWHYFNFFLVATLSLSTLSKLFAKVHQQSLGNQGFQECHTCKFLLFWKFSVIMPCCVISPAHLWFACQAWFPVLQQPKAKWIVWKGSAIPHGNLSTRLFFCNFSYPLSNLLGQLCFSLCLVCHCLSHYFPLLCNSFAIVSGNLGA